MRRVGRDREDKSTRRSRGKEKMGDEKRSGLWKGGGVERRREDEGCRRGRTEHKEGEGR